MERIGEESVANDIIGNTELKRKECNLQNYTDTLEAKDLHRCVTSMVGSEPPRTSPCSTNDTGVLVEELTVGTYRTMNPGLVSSPSSSRQGQWQNLYQWASGFGYKASNKDSTSQDKDRIMLRVSEQYMKMASDIKNPNFLSRKRIDQLPEEISPYIRASDNMIVSSNTMRTGSAQLKTLSSSGFAQLFVKKTSKGKGIFSRCSEARKEFDCEVAGQNDEKLGCVTEVALDSFLESSANNDLLLTHGVNRPGHESYGDGICLREWLELGYRKREKVESMHIFRQIVEFVDSAHSQGLALLELRPSYLYLWPLNKVIYTGSFVKRELEAVVNQALNKKGPPEQYMQVHCGLGAKQQKLSDDMKSLTHQPQFSFSCISRTKKLHDIDFHENCSPDCGYFDVHTQNHSSYQSTSTPLKQQSVFATSELEEKWYSSPEELNDSSCSFSSNIYGLGVLLFELLCYVESPEVRFAVMSNLCHRILPPNFLSEHPKEAGFCLQLLHPQPSSRPTTREILHSELTCMPLQELQSLDDSLIFTDDEVDSEILLHFLNSLKEQKQKHASKLVENIRCLEEDIKEVEERYFQKTSSLFSQTHEEYLNVRKQSLRFGGPVTSPLQSFSMPNMNEARLMRNISQLENAYFSIRSQIRIAETSATRRSDKDLLINRDRWSEVQNTNEESNRNKKSVDHLGTFFEGLSKFTRYSKFEVCGTLGNADLLNSANVICSLSFDRDEEYIAAAGVSKRIKIFEFNSLLNDSIDIHYPAVEMSNKSKLSCVCWNNYIKNYLASTDYDGVVQIWDAGTGQGFSQYTEHAKRAWSVDFSQTDPTKFASGSDDCSVKLWSINEKSSAVTIRNPANVCCVQFSAFSSHMLAFGSADYKVYCYDLRNTIIPWCTLAGHDKAVSYVKFLDSETLVSASTDNTLKLWDLRKSSPAGIISGACSLTFRGHTNEKNFVGLSVLDGYIACGSETNEVYCYYRSLPMPITSYKFGSIDPISGHEIGDENGQFVSSVCWRQKSNMVVAANSSGCIKLLQMVQ